MGQFEYLLAQLDTCTDLATRRVESFPRVCGFGALRNLTIRSQPPARHRYISIILLAPLSDRPVEETLLILQFLGVQISSTSRSYLSTSTTRFIPTTAIQDVFIHEAFTGFEVRYYLGIVVEGEKEVMVVFGRLMPGLKVLEKVWRGVRRVLYLQDEGNGHRKRATAET